MRREKVQFPPVGQKASPTYVLRLIIHSSSEHAQRPSESTKKRLYCHLELPYRTVLLGTRDPSSNIALQLRNSPYRYITVLPNLELPRTVTLHGIHSKLG